jgi:hypothetical protein
MNRSQAGGGWVPVGRSGRSTGFRGMEIRTRVFVQERRTGGAQRERQGSLWRPVGVDEASCDVLAVVGLAGRGSATFLPDPPGFPSLAVSALSKVGAAALQGRALSDRAEEER